MINIYLMEVSFFLFLNPPGTKIKEVGKFHINIRV